MAGGWKPKLMTRDDRIIRSGGSGGLGLDLPNGICTGIRNCGRFCAASNPTSSTSGRNLGLVSAQVCRLRNRLAPQAKIVSERNRTSISASLPF